MAKKRVDDQRDGVPENLPAGVNESPVVVSVVPPVAVSEPDAEAPEAVTIPAKKGLPRYLELVGTHCEKRDEFEDAEMAAFEQELIEALPLLRRTIDALLYGCHSTREREDAARPVIELLNRLIGA